MAKETGETLKNMCSITVFPATVISDESPAPRNSVMAPHSFITEAFISLRSVGSLLTASTLETTSEPHLDCGLGRESAFKTPREERSTRAAAMVVVPMSNARPVFLIILADYKSFPSDPFPCSPLKRYGRGAAHEVFEVVVVELYA